MHSVRLRLLILALAPLIVLIPLLLVLGVTRWTADYDKVLIANVESDLRIAEQYLARLMSGTGKDLQGLTGSVEFKQMMQTGGSEAFFEDRKQALGLDFLYYLPAETAAAQADTWPVIATGLTRTDTQIDIFPASALAALPGALATQARIELIETEAAVPTDRTAEDRGMVVHSASPVTLAGQEGVLVGGILLNRNLDFIDSINALVYLNAVTGGERQGTATLFLDDVRISTNVRLFEDVRALGTRVSAAVRGHVLGQGQTWLNRAFVVNDWYISGYLPLTDSFGKRVGMLYVGFLEAPFTAAKRAAFLWMLAAFFAVLVGSAPVFLRMARGIFAPLERMTRTMDQVRDGNLSARMGAMKRRDEIAAVAGHLDDLLDQVQDRDRRLRAYAEDLNHRVEERTAELREANAKLEDTYRQLVMSEKLASIGEITAGVAHEINNPVAVIQGNLDLVIELLGEQAGPVDTELKLIDAQVGRIQAIVGKLLKFAAPDELDDFGGTTDLAPVVRDCLVLVEHEIGKAEITVETKLDDVPAVTIAAGEMQQVVVNLIVNAAQAMGRGGRLGLHLYEEARDGRRGCCLRVRDTGPGIPEDKLASVFDPFFTTKRGVGTGLGLSISQTLIQRAGGLVSVRNRAEGGAEFTIWLPLAEDSTAAA